MQPAVISSIMNGVCIFPDAYKIPSFDPNEYAPDDWYSLSNGRMIDRDGKVLKEIHFDFNGGEVLPDGYVKGFIYADRKFFGKFYYLATSNMPSEKLEGTYNFIDNGIEIKGLCFSGNDKYGLFVRLTISSNVKVIERSTIPVLEKKTRAKGRKKAPPLETHKNVLTKVLVQSIAKKAAPIKLKNRATKFDHYQHVVDLKPKPTDFDNVIMAISIAYSWMPTMLDIYLSDVKNKKRIVKAVQNLGTINSLEDFEKQQKNISSWLTELVDVVNHSIVGVSKTLHIFFPKNIPIIDSRVLKAWNDLYNSKFRNNKELKLPLHIPLTTKLMVATYIRYWRCLLCWGHNTRINDLRKIEESLYWLGGKGKK